MKDSLPVKLPSGRVIKVEIDARRGEEDVGAIPTIPFKDISDSIEEIAKTFYDTFKRISPDKASIELGIEISMESGALTAGIVKGSGKANFTITLEWHGGNHSE